MSGLRRAARSLLLMLLVVGILAATPGRALAGPVDWHEVASTSEGRGGDAEFLFERGKGSGQGIGIELAEGVKMQPFDAAQGTSFKLFTRDSQP